MIDLAEITSLEMLYEKICESDDYKKIYRGECEEHTERYAKTYTDTYVKKYMEKILKMQKQVLMNNNMDVQKVANDFKTHVNLVKEISVIVLNETTKRQRQLCYIEDLLLTVRPETYEEIHMNAFNLAEEREYLTSKKDYAEGYLQGFQKGYVNECMRVITHCLENLKWSPQQICETLNFSEELIDAISSLEKEEPSKK